MILYISNGEIKFMQEITTVVSGRDAIKKND